MEILLELKNLIDGARDVLLELLGETDDLLSALKVLLTRLRKQLLREAHETLEYVLLKLRLLIFSRVDLRV
jgi:hypothetical protein